MYIKANYKGKTEHFYLFTYEVDNQEELMRVRELDKSRYELVLGEANNYMTMTIEKASNMGLDILSEILKNDIT
jgi:hypothetical protein